ncbi:MAG TPA: hypothetical protein VIR00_13045 [Micromonosporaceae bacterium]|jgi:hypothetical protein
MDTSAHVLPEIVRPAEGDAARWLFEHIQGWLQFFFTAIMAQSDDAVELRLASDTDIAREQGSHDVRGDRTAEVP